MTGRLVVVGTGIGAARLTAEARAAIEAADELLYLIPDAISVHAVRQLNPRSRSLEHCYIEGEHHREAYGRMVEAILEPVRAGRNVCAAFYGHPGVFVLPSHEAVKQARLEGFEATMLPGISPRTACSPTSVSTRPRRTARATRRPGSSSGVPRSSRGRRSSCGRSAWSAPPTTRPKPSRRGSPSSSTSSGALPR